MSCLYRNYLEISIPSHIVAISRRNWVASERYQESNMTQYLVKNEQFKEDAAQMLLE